MRLILKGFLVFVLLAFTMFVTVAPVSVGYQADVPVPMAQLLPDKRIKATVILQGHIRLTPQPSQAKLSQSTDYTLFNDPRKVLPTIMFDLIQDEKGAIIPLQRSLTLSDNPYWDYFVGVGEIWQSSINSNIHKVALPFALVEKNENCVHNGVLTFSLDQQQRPGDFYYQISSETCAYFKADFWGSGKTEFDQANITNARQVIEQYRHQRAQQLPVRPIQDIALLAPTISLDALALDGIVNLTDMTLYGLVFNDVHYASECFTRAGNYPFCEQLVLPSYSTAKTLFAGLSMFYLQQRFGDVFTQAVSQWVPECKGEQWQNVTFAHLLDMSTGNYDSAKYGEDEAADAKLAFFNASDHVNKINFSCNHYSRNSEPGSQFVYHTSDTYLLGTALTNYLKSKLGEKADLFNDILLKQIFKPLSLSQITYASRRTVDKLQQPYSGYGLFFTRDDIARLSRYISQFTSQFINLQASAPEKVSSSAQQPLQTRLQALRAGVGLPTDYSFIRYRHSFWARNINSLTQCQQDTWLPFMSGFGGITVALLPGNNSYYYFSDSHQYNWSGAVPQLAKLQSLCATAPANNSSAAQQEK